jgi:tRNA1(Val) A37 N6-methylase TrmN6
MTDAGGYKTTSDAVWLSKAVSAKPMMTALDVGVGPGGMSLCLLDRFPKLKITGIDVSEKMLSDAETNASLNGRELELIHADILKWKTPRLFDLVATNPPYFKGTPRLDGAHHNADIYAWTRACARRLKCRGVFYCIVSPDCVAAVIAALYDSKCGGMEIRPILGASGAICRVIVSGRLGVKTPSKILMPAA